MSWREMCRRNGEILRVCHVVSKRKNQGDSCVVLQRFRRSTQPALVGRSSPSAAVLWQSRWLRRAHESNPDAETVPVHVPSVWGGKKRHGGATDADRHEPCQAAVLRLRQSCPHAVSISLGSFLIFNLSVFTRSVVPFHTAFHFLPVPFPVSFPVPFPSFPKTYFQRGEYWQTFFSNHQFTI